MQARAIEPYQRLYLYKRIVQAKLYIDAHYHSDIDIENIASQACFSKFHFIRTFKSVYGKTPHHYLMQVRIDQAKTLLQQQASITEACYAVGFSSATSFSLLFKKLTGYSPSAYQQQALKRFEQTRTNPLSMVPNCFAETYGWNKNSNFQ